jgi:predicted PurR-regulated permease PerM
MEQIKPSPAKVDLNRIMVVLLLVMGAALLFPMVKLFFVSLILSLTFTVLFFPLFKFLTKLLWGNRVLGALGSCMVLLLGLLIPAYLMVYLVATQALSFYDLLMPRLRELLEQNRLQQFIDTLPIPGGHLVQLNQIDWSSLLRQGASTLGQLGTTIVNRTSAGLFGLLGNLFITLFVMFYLFLDGEALVRRVRYLSPLRSDYEELLASRFVLIARATVKGTLLIGLAQGALGALTLLVFGIKSWLLWGVVMIILAVIPMMGAWLVLIPAGLFQLMSGNVWQGIGIMVCSLVVVSNVDNLLRPRLVGKGAKLHDLLIFFSTLGGIAVFGIMGFIIGPVLAALVMTIVDIYGIEFSEQLQALHAVTPVTPVEPPPLPPAQDAPPPPSSPPQSTDEA